MRVAGQMKTDLSLAFQTAQKETEMAALPMTTMYIEHFVAASEDILNFRSWRISMEM